MCRWMAYSGKRIPLETLLFRAKHNLIDQSLSAHSASTPTNGDGFGLGWYDSRETPGLFRSIRPAWNDANLRDLAAQVDSHLFLAHVRASSYAAVQETNCHPFRHGRWLFVHNGEIADIKALRRDLMLEVDPTRFDDVVGTTDSEVMFHLALSLGLEQDPHAALERMAGVVERVGRAHGVEQALWMTIGVSDGTSVWAVRYASDGRAPTLFHSREMSDLAVEHPELAEHLGPHARAVVSEPIGKYAEAWQLVPAGFALHLCGDVLEMVPFTPRA